MQPSSLPASIGDAAIVSAASARADHMHVPQDIAGFDDSVASIGLRVIEFDCTAKYNKTEYYQVDPIEPGVYAICAETSASVDIPIPDSEQYALCAVSLSFPDTQQSWMILSDKISSSGDAVKGVSSINFSLNKKTMKKSVTGLLIANSETSFGVGENTKARLYVRGDQASDRGGRVTTVTTRVKLRKLA
ncbi:hypothetical protein DX903_05665 [Adlercreutzia equolifaciens]|nr:hypothetical protein DX903_05665 [Adlercreutzia equolifaciens]